MGETEVKVRDEKVGGRRAEGEERKRKASRYSAVYNGGSAACGRVSQKVMFSVRPLQFGLKTSACGVKS